MLEYGFYVKNVLYNNAEKNFQHYSGSFFSDKNQTGKTQAEQSELFFVSLFHIITKEK